VSALASYKRFGERFMEELADLDESLWFAQPHGQVNHPAWTVGHLCVVGGRCVGMLGGIEPPIAFQERFGNGSVPAPGPPPGSATGTSDDEHPSNTALLKMYRMIHASVHELAAKCPAEKLDEPNPIERLRGFQPTVGDIVGFMVGAHEAYHIAQFFSWKKALESSR
jgi:hypothetical protein